MNYMSAEDMNYMSAVEELKKAFRELAVAKQNVLVQGGEINFDVKRDSLHMSIDSTHTSFPFKYPDSILEEMKEKWQEGISQCGSL